MTEVEITAIEANNISKQNNSRCVTALEQIYLDITKASHCGCYSVVTSLDHRDRTALIKNGFKVEPWYYNQYRIIWGS